MIGGPSEENEWGKMGKGGNMRRASERKRKKRDVRAEQKKPICQK